MGSTTPLSTLQEIIVNQQQLLLSQATIIHNLTNVLSNHGISLNQPISEAQANEMLAQPRQGAAGSEAQTTAAATGVSSTEDYNEEDSEEEEEEEEDEEGGMGDQTERNGRKSS